MAPGTRGRAESQARKAVGFKASAAEKARWTSEAAARGLPLNTWLRELADAAALRKTGGVPPPHDTDFLAALARVQDRLPVRDPSEVVRMCVIAVDRMLRGKAVNPFDFPEPEPAAAAAPKAASTRRRSGG